MKKVLFLYTELAGEIVSCFNALANEGVDVHVVRWPVKAEAPFEFDTHPNVHLYNRTDLDDSKLLQLSVDLAPDAVFVSGWVDKGYLQVARHFRSRVSVTLLLDNHYTGSWKQRIVSLLSFHFIKPFFNHAWVPGSPQKVYAERLGFGKANIKTGFYCADTDLFDAHFAQFGAPQENAFIFIGRYVPFKGIYDLWEAFSLFSEEFPDWKLYCLGTGDHWEQRKEHPKIEHVGFVQPKDLSPWLQRAGVFVLPSHREPWGVVVHEMAAAGFPLICSDTIGAASMFLSPANGLDFKAGQSTSLLDAMRTMGLKSQDQRIQMAQASRSIAQTLTKQKWVQTALEIVAG
ncbi:MAG: hypothetical protein RL226_551 [Bacteroidota bacterium]